MICRIVSFSNYPRVLRMRDVLGVALGTATALALLYCFAVSASAESASPKPEATAQTAPTQKLEAARIIAISDDRASLTVQEEQPGGPSHNLSVPDKTIRAKLDPLQAGDLEDVEFVTNGNEVILKGIAPSIHPHLLADARVTAIAEDQSSMTVIDLKSRRRPPPSYSLSAKGKELQATLKSLAVGDEVIVDVGQEGNQQVLKSAAAARVVAVSSTGRMGALLLAAAALLILAVIFLGRPGIPGLLIGRDGRYSNSKFQMIIWFGVVIVTYIATIWLRWRTGGSGYAGGVNLPQNLLLLSGLSTLSFAGAKGITTGKIATAKANAQAQPGATVESVNAAIANAKPPAGANDPNFLQNLACDDQGNPDIGDFQMVVVTILAVAVYLAQIWAFLGAISLLKAVSIPDVDTTILATFGLGQGAYLAKKYVGDGK